MTEKEFREFTGEDPADVLGTDWENEIEEFENDDSDRFYFNSLLSNAS